MRFPWSKTGYQGFNGSNCHLPANDRVEHRMCRVRQQLGLIMSVAKNSARSSTVSFKKYKIKTPITDQAAGKMKTIWSREEYPKLTEDIIENTYVIVVSQDNIARFTVFVLDPKLRHCCPERYKLGGDRTIGSRDGCNIEGLRVEEIDVYSIVRASSKQQKVLTQSAE